MFKGHFQQSAPSSLPQNKPEKQDEIEYLFIEENPFGIKEERPKGSFGPLPMRTNSDKLLYGVGAMYMLGLLAGGSYGLYRGLNTSTHKSFKLSMNAILNQVTRYGPMSANSIAVVTMGWVIADYSIEKYRQKSDYFGHIGSAFLSGFLFKSTAGLRSAGVTGAMAASIVAAYGAFENRERLRLAI